MIDLDTNKLAPRGLEISREQVVVNFQQDLLIRAWLHGADAAGTVEVVEMYFRASPRPLSVQ